MILKSVHYKLLCLIHILKKNLGSLFDFQYNFRKDRLLSFKSLKGFRIQLIKSKFIFSIGSNFPTFLILFFLPISSCAQGLLYNIDFSDSSVLKQDRFYLEACCSYSFTISDSEENDGNPSGRFQLNYGNPQIDGGVRAEFETPTINSTKELWIGFALYLPISYVYDDQGDITGQVHDQSGISPPLSIFNSKGHTYITVRYDLHSTPSNNTATVYNYDLGTTLTGQWVDYVIHEKFSTGSDGLVQIWRNGAEVVNYSGPLGYDNSGYPYVKFGIYKWPWSSGPSEVSSRVAYYDDIKIAGPSGSYALVAPPSSTTSTNQSPVANAGDDSTLVVPVNTLTLDGSASYDPFGTITQYNWTQVSGPSVTINNADSIQATINNLSIGTYQFKLTVTDSAGANSSADVTITVVDSSANQSPIANAGRNAIITLPVNSITLNGSRSYSPGGTITQYSWAEVNGPGTANISSGNSSRAIASNLVVGTYQFRLTVTNNNNLSDTASVFVTVQSAPNQPPVANAGQDTTVTLPVNSVFLNGGASYDPDGTIVNYNWAEVSGPAQYTITGSNSVNASISGLVAGTYVFSLTVTDNSGATATNTVRITVLSPNMASQPLVANPGSDVTITLPVDSTYLNGTQSYDLGGNIVQYSWSEVSGSSGYTISNPDSSVVLLSNLLPGTYIFQLTVTSNTGDTASAEVQVTVNNGSLTNYGNIVLYPNPATTNLNVSFYYNDNGPIALNIYDMSGRLITTYQYVKTNKYDFLQTINVSNLTPGMYIMSLQLNNNYSTSSQFVKM
jgi:Polysaccharide lyase/K319L-like, PKD domain/Secretion system C-terminal sorting domain